jgi:hypothetical protein
MRKMNDEGYFRIFFRDSLIDSVAPSLNSLRQKNKIEVHDRSPLSFFEDERGSPPDFLRHFLAPLSKNKEIERQPKRQESKHKRISDRKKNENAHAQISLHVPKRFRNLAKETE